jgi:proline dehydrogenase
MLRQFFLYLSNRQQLYRFIRKNKLARYFASRFVAGETLDEAVNAVRALNASGISASLDLLGESVTNEAEARAAGDEYLRILDRIRSDSLNCNVSLKLTAMGLDISESLCEDVVRKVLDRARDYDIFVRLDMEGSEYTERTLRFFEDRLYPVYPRHVGIVLQSYLYRTRKDVERAIELQCRVRLCKGAYKEPETIAFPAKKDVDASYIECMHRLMQSGNYPGIATHDEAIIADAKRFARETQVGTEKFEFQMLYGIRRDLQAELVRDKYRLRVYIPFGTQWYPYLMRRLAERPANIAFILGSVVKEGGRIRRH